MSKDLQDHFGKCYEYDSEAQQRLMQQRPWTRQPEYFKHIHVSALAIMKMFEHADSAGELEIMGLMQGKIEDRAFIVADVFALPVEGTETRVNAHAEAYEYMVEYVRLAKLAGRDEDVVGWYHSHPSYGCWLSGIDVQTQRYHQHFQEPFVAIVIDPVKTRANRKLEIGAFRTFPSGDHQHETFKKRPETTSVSDMNEERLKDFGAHHDQYYSLELSYYKSELDGALIDDLLATKWLDVIASNPIITDTDRVSRSIEELANELEESSKASIKTSLQRWIDSKKEISPDFLGDLTKRAHLIAEEIRQNAVFFKERCDLLDS
jgi:COP9 signalosome complex subunit 5